MGNRIELRGRVLSRPELRVAPGGTALLRVLVECGAGDEELRMAVMMAGEGAREAAAQLRVGEEVYVSGHLRATGPAGNAGIVSRSIEVMAAEIKPQGG